MCSSSRKMTSGGLRVTSIGAMILYPLIHGELMFTRRDCRLGAGSAPCHRESPDSRESYSARARPGDRPASHVTPLRSFASFSGHLSK
jgi:hypothetical protein